MSRHFVAKTSIPWQSPMAPETMLFSSESLSGYRQERIHWTRTVVDFKDRLDQNPPSERPICMEAIHEPIYRGCVRWPKTMNSLIG
jgi:hypothetical protein